MNNAFDNFFAVAEVLREDLVELLDVESDSQGWRRSFVRASASLIEGYAHCIREMCVVGFDCLAPSTDPKEVKVLLSEGKFSADDRIKLTLRAAHKIFELYPEPNFRDPEWRRAQLFLEKRNILMHPKSQADLQVSDRLWSDIFVGVSWLCEQLFAIFAALEKKHARPSRLV